MNICIHIYIHTAYIYIPGPARKKPHGINSVHGQPKACDSTRQVANTKRNGQRNGRTTLTPLAAPWPPTESCNKKAPDPLHDFFAPPAPQDNVENAKVLCSDGS